MRFSAAARNRRFTNLRTSPRAGLRTTPAPPRETTDATCRKICFAFPAPLLARPSGMVRRRRLRKLPPFEGPSNWLLPHALSSRVLRGAAQSPLFQTKSLLLKITPTRGLPLLSLRSRLATTSVGPYTYFFRRDKCSVRPVCL